MDYLEVNSKLAPCALTAAAVRNIQRAKSDKS